MTVEMQPRIINGTKSYDMPTVDGMDRCQINTRLHYLNVEMDKLKAETSALIGARNQLDRHAEMLEMMDKEGNLFTKCSELIDDHVFHHVSDCVPGYTSCKITS